MTDDDPGLGVVLTNSLKLIALGGAFVAGYFVLAAFTTVGDRGDIGGGLILTAGYFLTGGGILLLVKDLRTHWTKRRK